MEEPQFTYNQGIVPPAEYNEWVKNLKLRYRKAQIKASVKVNSELIRFWNWDKALPMWGDKWNYACQKHGGEMVV